MKISYEDSRYRIEVSDAVDPHDEHSGVEQYPDEEIAEAFADLIDRLNPPRIDQFLAYVVCKTMELTEGLTVGGEQVEVAIHGFVVAAANVIDAWDQHDRRTGLK